MTYNDEDDNVQLPELDYEHFDQEEEHPEDAEDVEDGEEGGEDEDEDKHHKKDKNNQEEDKEKDSSAASKGAAKKAATVKKPVAKKAVTAKPKPAPTTKAPTKAPTKASTTESVKVEAAGEGKAATPSSKTKATPTPKEATPTDAPQSKTKKVFKSLTAFATQQLVDTAISSAGNAISNSISNSMDGDDSSENEKKPHQQFKSLAHGKLAPGAPVKKAIAPAPEESNMVARIFSSPKMIPIKLSLGFVGAAALAGGHHAYLTMLHNKSVASTVLSQGLTISSNVAITVAVKMFIISAIVTCALKPIIRTSIRRSELSAQQIDSLVALPAITNIISTPSLWIRHSHVIVLSLLATACALITVRVPAALVTTNSPSVETPMWISYPGWNDANTTILYSAQIVNGSYYQPTQAFEGTVASALTSNLSPSYESPYECGMSCSYNMTYEAPALQCVEIPPEMIWDGSGDEPAEYMSVLLHDVGNYAYLWNATSSWYSNITNGNLTLTVTTRSMDIYSNTTDSLGDVTGAYCTFFTANYDVTITYGQPSVSSEDFSKKTTAKVNNVPFQETIINKIEYLKPLTLDWYKDEMRLINSTDNLPELYNINTTYITRANYQAAAQVYISWLVGTVSWELLYRVFLYSGTRVAVTSLVTVNDALGQWLYELDIDDPDPIWKTLPGLFSNATLAFNNPYNPAGFNVWQEINGTNTSYDLVWHYTPWIVFEVYLPSLIIAFLCTIIGFVFYAKGEIPNEGDFTQVFAVGKTLRDQGFAMGKQAGTMKVGQMWNDMF